MDFPQKINNGSLLLLPVTLYNKSVMEDPDGDNVSEQEYPDIVLQEHLGLKYAILVSYLTTFVFGIIGNGLVLFIITYYKTVRTKSVANYYIWNLSFADLLFILTLPFFCYATYKADWPFGEVFCKTAFAIRETNRFASVFTLVALSIDRYMASFYSLSSLRTIKLGKLTCVIIWLICLATTTPYWLHAKTTGTIKGKTSCRFAWPIHQRSQNMAIWTYFQLSIGLILPFILISASYILLVNRLKKILKPGVNSQIKKPSRNMTKTVLVVVSTFLICQTPYHALEVIALKKTEKVDEYLAQGKKYMPPDLEITIFLYLNALAQILVFISSCCNPIIYGLLNKNYRELYHITLCTCETHPTSETLPSSDSQIPYVPVTYRFHISFHLPCTPIPHWTPFLRRRSHKQHTEDFQLTVSDKPCTSSTVRYEPTHGIYTGSDDE